MAGTALVGEAVRVTVAALTKDHDAPIRAEERLREDLHLDSMAQLELAMALEERLGRPVADATVMKSRTVADLIAALG